MSVYQNLRLSSFHHQEINESRLLPCIWWAVSGLGVNVSYNSYLKVAVNSTSTELNSKGKCEQAIFSYTTRT